MHRYNIFKIKITFCIFVVILVSFTHASALEINWTIIGDKENEPDNQVMITDGTTGYGSVSYEFQIAKYEVTTEQYVQFLNAVASISDTYGLYNSNMSNSQLYKGIIRTENTEGGYNYSVNTGWKNKPVVYVSWYDSLRFANWIHNGQPIGVQGPTTTEDGAYNMSLGTEVVRQAGAKVFLPNENEWYKAAYYDPIFEVYYDYATASNIEPNNNAPSSDTGNSANYSINSTHPVGWPFYTTDVGVYILSGSPYGIYDQNGNVWEWIETSINDSSRVLRGGSWTSDVKELGASYRPNGNPTIELYEFGFRLASVVGLGETIPEPSSIILLVLGVVGLIRKFHK